MSEKPKATIDFETYYDKTTSVSEQGIGNYARDTDAYLVTIATDEWEFAGSPADLEKDLGTRWMDDFQPQAFNSNFDQTIWEEAAKLPAFKDPWYCVSDACAVNQYPRNLANASKVILGEDKSKDVRAGMKGVRFETLSEEAQQEVIDYGLDDAVREHRLGKKVAMSDFEARVAMQTRRINRRGIMIDRNLLDKSMIALEDAKFGALKRIPWRQDSAVLSPKALALFCQANGATCPASRDKKSVEFTAFLSANPSINHVVEAMRIYDTANKRQKKLEAMIRRIREDGTMPIELMYCGAPHTRRWSSRGVNVQNLERDPLDLTDWLPEDAPLKLVWQRSLLIPRPNKILYALDLAQIEPRCQAWLVDDQALLDAVRAGFPVYEAYARAKLKWTGGSLKKEDPVKYQKTKNNFLGSGYGMGGQKLFDTNPGMFESVEEANQTVAAFRRDNPKVVAQWGEFDRLVKGTATNLKDSTIEIEMPTGEYLKHFFVRPMGGGKRGMHSYTIKGEFSENAHIYNLWGGVVTENVTQRMARDVLATQLLRFEDAGFQLLFTAHDEAVLELDIDNAADAVKEIDHLMTLAPDWAPDLPLGCEGKLITRYTKI